MAQIIRLAIVLKDGVIQSIHGEGASQDALDVVIVDRDTQGLEEEYLSPVVLPDGESTTAFITNPSVEISPAFVASAFEEYPDVTEGDGTEGQDRESYSDDQDRESYQATA